VISLVLLGLRLPRLLGLELLARACECGLTALTPFIVFTSADNAAERARALQRGARDYLVKPLGLGPLKRLVTKLYDRWIAPSTSASG
jgi:DNA-binding response OmpR family regulator